MHLIQSWRDVTHHGHEKEGYLQNSVFEVMQTINNGLVPGRMVHIHEE